MGLSTSRGWRVSETKPRGPRPRTSAIPCFMWEGLNHNVYMFTGEASKAAFESCDFTDAMDLGSMSPIEHKLTALPAYFACKVEDHCVQGQKLAVTAEM